VRPPWPLLAVLGIVACGEAPAPDPGPPAEPHGTVVLEPERLGVGDLVTVEIVVVTGPEHRLRPVQLPAAIPPLWLLDAERLPVRRQGERWTHVTRVRARVREAPGAYVWPALEVEWEDPDGASRTLVLEERPFAVISVAGSFPDRVEPFGLRSAAPGPPARGGFFGPALVGSAATLLGLAALRLGRRRRARAHERAASARPDDTPPWITAERDLAAARDHADADPRRAADEAAMALRRYVHRRTNRPVESLTTEEISAQRPPGRLRSRWPELLSLLRQLDGLRFPGELDRDEGRSALRTTLEEARAFVERSVPPRELR